MHPPLLSHVLVSGGFDPLHVGHVDLLTQAGQHGRVLVALNSDAWLMRKKGYAFMPWGERAAILKALACVDNVVAFNDDDDSAADAILQCQPAFFAKGGDRTLVTLPVQEIKACEEVGAKILCGLGTKIQSSSRLIERATAVRHVRPWGYYVVLEQTVASAVKHLHIARGQAISLQYHKNRSETWTFSDSNALARVGQNTLRSHPGLGMTVPVNMYHRIVAEFGDVDLIEVQTPATPGARLRESDIVRIEDKYGRTTL